MFWKLFLGQAIVLALVATGFHLLAIPAIEREVIASEGRSLAEVSSLLRGTLPQSVPSLPPTNGPEANSGISVRLFDRAGKAITDPRQLAPAPFPEILELEKECRRLGGSAVEVGRRSSRDHALRLASVVAESGSTPYVLYVSKYLAPVDRWIERIQRQGNTLLLLAAGCLALWSFAWTRLWKRRLRSVQNEIAPLVRERIGVESLSTIPALDEWERLEKIARGLSEEVRLRIDGIDQARRDLQTMLEMIPEAVLAIDAEQRVLFANASTYKLFGLPTDDIAGKKLWAILRQPGLQDAVSMTFSSKEPTSTEFAIRRPARVVRYYGRGLTVGSGRGIIIVLHDVSELRRLERLRQDFFASVSHELKTPLAAIKAYTETLLDGEQHDPHLTRRFLLRVEEQADRLHSLVIDMLMLARVESEDHGFDIKPIDARPAIQNSVDYFREKAQAKQVEVESQLLPEPCTVMADSEGLGMIVRNLVDNAVKYTPPGGTVRVVTRQAHGDVIIEVHDTGVGIPADDLHRIFERFYRVDKARSRELGGTGLGLSIVKHLVQRFGGSVGVQSRLHEGSTFTVSLPLAMGRNSSKQGLVEQETTA